MWQFSPHPLSQISLLGLMFSSPDFQNPKQLTHKPLVKSQGEYEPQANVCQGQLLLQQILHIYQLI